MMMNKYRLIIAGGRDFKNYKLLKISADKIASEFKNIVIISGTAKGADTLGEDYAMEMGFDIKQYPADWNKYGKSAGYKRNMQMAENADGLLAFWDGKSRGTGHMISIAKEKKLDVFVVSY